MYIYIYLLILLFSHIYSCIPRCYVAQKPCHLIEAPLPPSPPNQTGLPVYKVSYPELLVKALYSDNGNENGNYCSILEGGSILGYIGKTEKKMETTMI